MPDTERLATRALWYQTDWQSQSGAVIYATAREGYKASAIMSLGSILIIWRQKETSKQSEHATNIQSTPCHVTNIVHKVLLNYLEKEEL